MSRVGGIRIGGIRIGGGGIGQAKSGGGVGGGGVLAVGCWRQGSLESLLPFFFCAFRHLPPSKRRLESLLSFLLQDLGWRPGRWDLRWRPRCRGWQDSDWLRTIYIAIRLKAAPSPSSLYFVPILYSSSEFSPLPVFVPSITITTCDSSCSE